MMSQAPVVPFPSGSLYVGDLGKDVAESTLYDLFTKVGPVTSIRLCKDSMTRESLGYAYVNFSNPQDAERALDTMNFYEIGGKPCRIMWSQRDPSLRRNGAGNVFVSNLAPSVDNKALYDTFSVFGNILSCKVVTDEKGESKGYGYVHFETADAAQDAIQKFDGTLIDDMEVRVGLFVKRSDRTTQQIWTNLYVKQFPLSWDEDKVKEVFAPMGPIANIAISKDETGKSRGFGFVNMADHESAAKAVQELHNKVFEEGETKITLYVGRAQKKAERVRELKNRRDAANAERISKYQGMNLYVKNISDTVMDEQFRDAFTPFGVITSVKIMRDENKVSRGFGFVCYSTADEASKAMAAMNGKVLGGKPLVVNVYQRKEVRRTQLAANYAPPNMRFPPNMPMPPFMGMYMGQQPPFQQPRGAPQPFQGYAPRGVPGAPRGGGQYPPRQQGGFFPPNSMPPQYMNQGGMGGPRGAPRQNYGPGPQGGMPGGYPPQGMPQGMPRPMPRPMQPGQMPPQMAPRGMVPVNPQGMPRGAMPYPSMPMVPQQPPRNPNVKFTNQARNQNPQGNMLMPQQMAPQPQQKMDFSQALLATPDPMQQKNMIGERLYPLIYQHAPEQAGKITGMLLEMDNGELLNLIESPDALVAKIDEAMTVLRNHSKDAI